MIACAALIGSLGVLATTGQARGEESIVMVAGQKQLFLDDYCVAEMEGLTRKLHQPTKSPLNPIIAANYP